VEVRRAELVRKRDETLDLLRANYIGLLCQKDHFIELLLNGRFDSSTSGVFYKAPNIRESSYRCMNCLKNYLECQQPARAENRRVRNNQLVGDNSEINSDIEILIRKHREELVRYKTELYNVQAQVSSKRYEIEIKALRDQLDIAKSQIETLGDHASTQKRLIEELTTGQHRDVSLVMRTNIGQVDINDSQKVNSIDAYLAAPHPAYTLSPPAPSNSSLAGAGATGDVSMNMFKFEKQNQLLRDDLRKVQSQILLLTTLIQGSAPTTSPLNLTLRDDNEPKIKVWNLELEAKYAQAADIIVGLKLDLERAQKKLEQYNVEVKKARQDRDNAVLLAERTQKKALFLEAELERAKAYILQLESEERTSTMTKTTTQKQFVEMQEMQEEDIKELIISSSDEKDNELRNRYLGATSFDGRSKTENNLATIKYDFAGTIKERSQTMRKLTPKEVSAKRKKQRAERSPLSKSLKFFNLRGKKKRKKKMESDWKAEDQQSSL